MITSVGNDGVNLLLLFRSQSREVQYYQTKMSSNGRKQCYVSTFRIQLKPPSALAPARNGPETADLWTSEKRSDTGKW